MSRAHPTGERLGPYEVLEKLGQGGLATVFRVRDPLGRHLALKLLKRSPSSAQSNALARFAREGEVTAALDHPGILRVHDAGHIDGRAYLVYELIEGTDFGEAIRCDPGYAQAHMSRGIAYGKLGRGEEALVDLAEAIRLEPDLGDAYLTRGVLKTAGGDKQGAALDFEQALRCNPNNPQGSQLRPFIEGILGRPSRY